MFVIGLIELFGAISLIFVNHAISGIAAITLVVVSLGATLFHIKYDSIKEGDANNFCIGLIWNTSLD